MTRASITSASEIAELDGDRLNMSTARRALID